MTPNCKYIKHFYYYCQWDYGKSMYYYIPCIRHLVGDKVDIKLSIADGKNSSDYCLILENVLELLYQDHIISMEEFKYFIDFFNNSEKNRSNINDNAINYITILEIIINKFNIKTNGNIFNRSCYYLFCSKIFI